MYKCTSDILNGCHMSQKALRILKRKSFHLYQISFSTLHKKDCLFVVLALTRWAYRKNVQRERDREIQGRHKQNKQLRYIQYSVTIIVMCYGMQRNELNRQKKQIFFLRVYYSFLDEIFEERAGELQEGPRHHHVATTQTISEGVNFLGVRGLVLRLRLRLVPDR